MTKKAIGFGLILLAFLLLAENSSLFRPGKDTISSGGKSTQGSEPIRLTILHNFSGMDNRSQTMRALIGEFQRAHPEIALDVQAIPSDGYRPRLQTVSAANETPDVFIMWPGAMTDAFVGGGLIQPINELLDQHPEWKAGFLPHSFDPFTVNGQIYAVPTGLSPTSFLFYNQEIFTRYHLQVPRTWNELIQVINALRQNDVTPIALGDKAGWPVLSSILSEVGDRIAGSQWFLDAASGRKGARFTDPQFLDALKHIRQLSDVAAFQSGYTSIDNTQAEQLFEQGKSAMLIDGGWALSQFSAYASPAMQKNMGVALMPIIPGGAGKPNSMSGIVATGFALSKNLSKAQQHAAYELIYALSGPQAQQRIVDSSQLVSYRAQPDPSKVSPIFLKAMKLVQSVEFTPVYDDILSTDATNVLERGLQQIMMDGNVGNVARQVQEAQSRYLQQ